MNILLHYHSFPPLLHIRSYLFDPLPKLNYHPSRRAERGVADDILSCPYNGLWSPLPIVSGPLTIQRRLFNAFKIPLYFYNEGLGLARLILKSFTRYSVRCRLNIEANEHFLKAFFVPIFHFFFFFTFQLKCKIT